MWFKKLFRKQKKQEHVYETYHELDGPARVNKRASKDSGYDSIEQPKESLTEKLKYAYTDLKTRKSLKVNHDIERRLSILKDIPYIDPKMAEPVSKQVRVITLNSFQSIKSVKDTRPAIRKFTQPIIDFDVCLVDKYFEQFPTDTLELNEGVVIDPFGFPLR